MNIRPDDKFLIQRYGTSYSVYGSDLAQYQQDKVDDQLAVFSNQLAQEEAARIDGDNELNQALDNIQAKIEIGVDALFPADWIADFDFSIEAATAVVNFQNTYNECLKTGDRESCYSTYIDSLYQEILALSVDHNGKFIGEFEGSSLNRFSNLRTLVVGGKDADTNDIDWASTVAGDLIEISRVTSGDERDRQVYSIYKIAKNWSEELGQNPLNEDPYILELEYIGGTPNYNYTPTAQYRFRYLADFKADITENFVERSGDKMTGNLVMESASIEFTDNVNGPYDSHFVKQSGDVTFKMETADVTIKSDGLITGAETTEGTEVKDVVNVDYLQSKLTIVDNETDRLDQKIDSIDQKLDAIAKITETFDYQCKYSDTCKTAPDIDAWTTCASGETTDGLFHVYLKSLAPNTIGSVEVDGDTVNYNNRIVISGVHANSGVNSFLSVLRHGDFLEFNSIDNEIQSIIFGVVGDPVTTDGVTSINVHTEFRYGPDANDVFQIDASYKIKHFVPSENITKEEIIQTYARLDGANFSGPITINNQGSTDTSFEIRNNTVADKVVIDNNAEVLVYSNTDTAKVIVQNATSNNIVELTNGGVNANKAFSLMISDNEKIVINPTSIDFKNNYIQNIEVNESNLKSAVNIEYLRNELATQNTRISTAADFVGSPNDGDTVRFNESLQKWEAAPISVSARGMNLFAQSEAEAEVGGMWTDGSNYFIRKK